MRKGIRGDVGGDVYGRFSPRTEEVFTNSFNDRRNFIV